MAQEPGPITVLDPAQFDLRPLPPGEVLPTPPEEAEFDALAAQLDQELEQLAGALEGDWDSELALLHLDAEEGIYHDPLVVDDAELVQAEAAAEAADGHILEAYEELPAETWQEIPAPFTPPTEEGGFYTGTDPGYPPTYPPGIPPPVIPPTPQGPIARLQNLSGGGDLIYHVGDQWIVTLSGTPDSPITCSGSHDGVPFGPAAYGLTDGLGHWSMQGAMSAAELGHWLEEWRIGGQLCTPVLVFDVVA